MSRVAEQPDFRGVTLGPLHPCHEMPLGGAGQFLNVMTALIRSSLAQRRRAGPFLEFVPRQRPPALVEGTGRSHCVLLGSRALPVKTGNGIVTDQFRVITSCRFSSARATEVHAASSA